MFGGEKLKKLDLGQGLGILANVGVLIGILLLVYELNQNREMMQAQTRNAISETLVDLLRQEATDPGLLEVGVKRAAGVPLTATEELSALLMEMAYWRYRENVNYQYRNGLFEESEYLAYREVWLRQLNTDEMLREIWCARQGQQSPEFVAEIEAQMERPCE